MTENCSFFFKWSHDFKAQKQRQQSNTRLISAKCSKSYSTTSIQPSHLRRYQFGKCVESIKKINNPSMTTHALTLVNVLARSRFSPAERNPQRSFFVVLLQVALTWTAVGVERFHNGCGFWARASAVRSQFWCLCGCSRK